MTRHLLVPLFAAAILVAATASAETPKEPEQTRKADPAGGQKAIPISGKVTEILTSGGYTYVNLSRDGVSTWVAFPTIPVTLGQELVLVPGYEMRNFTSKTLNRTFDRVVFSLGPTDKQGVDPNLVKAAHKSRDAQAQPPAGKPAEKPVPQAPPPQMIPAPAVTTHSTPLPMTSGVPVKKASGPNAFTVRQLYDRRAALDRKKVVVRGKVIKVNRGILKRSWVHLQDGTGKPGMEDSRLVTTTPSTNKKLPLVGDVVTATGILRKDPDFGGGYRYYVVLEETTYRKDSRKKK
jgi:hypothetical protein